VGSLLAVLAGLLLGLGAALVGVTNGAFVIRDRDVIEIGSAPAAWTVAGLGILAALAVLGGLVGGLVSWIGALLNTVQLADKTWFIVLLVLGLLSFGLVAMIAYVIAGPDGTKQPTAASA
jgi:H+/Cl- antiporter ClcA